MVVPMSMGVSILLVMANIIFDYQYSYANLDRRIHT